MSYLSFRAGLKREQSIPIN
jgi:hypothetical protein